MLKEVISLYLQGLLLATIFVAIWSGIRIMLRMLLEKDKTVKERRAHLFDTLIIAAITIPILSFAMVGILFIFRA